MDIFVKSANITIRWMEDSCSDYSLMLRWLTDEQVLEFYEGRDKSYSINQVKTKFGPRIQQEVKIFPCIIYYKNTPVGYIQYYPVENAKDYELENAEDTYAIDMFIGEPKLWGYGIGSKVLSLLIKYIFSKLQANKIVIDPHIDNPRAIRAYEKVGFKKVKLLVKHELFEGKKRDCWLMEIRKDYAKMDE